MAENPNRIYLPIQLDQITVSDWYPTPTPTGRPQQVHLVIDLVLQGGGDDPLPVSLVTRFKTAQALDRTIEQLLLHRESVWGPWRRDPTIREDLDGWRGGR